MHLRSVFRLFATVLLSAAIVVPTLGQAPPAGPGAPAAGVPKNLRTRLAAPDSELRLVVGWYAADRATLNGNYTAFARGGGGGGRAGAATSPVLSLSTSRIARLKRFDLDWQAALASIDATTLTPAARKDLAALSASIAEHLAQLDADAAAIALVSPLVPFAGAVIRLSEARTKLEELDPQKAAGVVDGVAKQAMAIRAGVEAGLKGEAGGSAMRVDQERAARGAEAVESLRAMLSEWFTFYNGYDPMFTWWVGMPYKQADAALLGYAGLLRDRVARAGLTPNLPAPAPLTVAPAAALPFPSVPDIPALMALPQDEMRTIVQMFRGAGARGGGRAGAEGQPPAAETRDRKFHQDWLAALKSLDFNALSRNAQVDYLFIRKSAEQQLARTDVALPANPPRKTDASGITGPARGRQGIIFDLQDEFIPYTPEELIAIAEREFAWCEAEVRSASRQMGLGDDWKQALERVKGMHPPPGGQVKVVRDLMFSAVDDLRTRDLLTIPQVASESLRMIMMTPERQLVNPFFTGGAVISVSYPTDTMDYDARIQSMRGNNTPFSHATAFHEMIPGHNFDSYMSARYAGYRASLARTSFWSEGWPLYWEMFLYDIGFHATPEEKVGALFWRMHRCARIIFSLRFHMGEWSPQECIDFLVDRVGHERDNATAEVRRSFQGSYGPLYQAAYLLGGLQMRGMRRELVEGGQMTAKAFHDEVLRQGNMPVALLRLALGRQKLTRDTAVDWRFYDAAAGLQR